MKIKIIKQFPIHGVDCKDETNSNYSEGEVIETDSCAYFRLAIRAGYAEEVKETKSVWDLKDVDKYHGVTCYGINSHGFIYPLIWDESLVEGMFAQGNIFLTREDAEKESKRRIARTNIIRTIHELGGEWDGESRFYCNSNIKGGIIGILCGSDIKWTESDSEPALRISSPEIAKEVLEKCREDYKVYYGI